VRPGASDAPESAHAVDKGAMPALPRTVWKLSARPAAAGLARSRIRAALAAWGLEACAEDAVLMASELVANAVCTARARSRSHSGSVRVAPKRRRSYAR
jgi:hypothetical protein